MRVVYIAGRFSAATQWQRRRNVHAAESLALAVAEAGAIPLNPLKNTEEFWGQLAEEFWYEGTRELLCRCDAMILVPNWEGSKGVTDELGVAKLNDIPVFERVDELKKWLSKEETA